MSTDKAVAPPLPEAVREQIGIELGLMTLASTWAEQNGAGIIAAFKRIAEAAAQQERARSAALAVECTCRVIEKCERCEAIDALASHPLPTPEERK